MAMVRNDQQMAVVFWIVAAIGALLGLIGSIVLIAAAHRALVKIDALPLRDQYSPAEDYRVRQY
ncbi:hypothetical protein [Pseudarthrobacter sp. LT1]|uniref:hypothetical protein n=1 Tax=Pseudarthrobacter sp. LT1 TaxID=3111450 RepID=UPI002D783CD9|nr:hypothetical protein [Pseudarthrobacter sp. LT1]WRT14639.1 hypothetical protein VIK36_03865 [Pseudarthrobacter sp. LT1]